MVMWLDRGAVSYSQMGGEGAQWWAGRRSPTCRTVQNVGDGTFFHPAAWPCAPAVSAGATMTFKILYNGVVAMTGGQGPGRPAGMPQLCQPWRPRASPGSCVVSEDPSSTAAGPAAIG
jgi:indolepyruvate ferredoxin oxidoreductase